MRYFTLIFLLSSFGLAAQSDSIPAKIHGIDFNVTDNQGLKQGEWIRVYEDGTTYCK